MLFFFYVLGFPSCFTVNDAPKQSNYCSSSGITIVIDEEAEAYGGKVQGCWVLSVATKIDAFLGTGTTKMNEH